MSAPRLSIRVDVDVEHARRALEAQVGSDAAAAVGKAALADVVRSLRERVRHDVAAAYPEARVVVTMWRKEPKARATKVRVGHRVVDGHVERRCALIAEHVDAIRAAAVTTLGFGVATPRADLAAGDLAPNVLSTAGDAGLPFDAALPPAALSPVDAEAVAPPTPLA
jgi:hypothetical protein